MRITVIMLNAITRSKSARAIDRTPCPPAPAALYRGFRSKFFRNPLEDVI